MNFVKRLLRKKLFVFGFTMICGLFFVSLLYLLLFKDYIPTAPLLYDENGKPLPAPYNGSNYPPLGTDEFGRNIAIVMLIGARYTISAAILISLLRVVPSIFIGLLLQFNFKLLKRPLKSIADSINYFPITLLAFLLLNWVSLEGPLMQADIPSFEIQVIIYIIVLSLIFIPINSILIANEVELIYTKEFIECSRTLGAGKWRIITKHISPFLIPQLWLIFIREFIQTLILMSHLGILSIFIGGVVFKENLFERMKPVSLSSEWAGALGMWWEYLWTSYPWIAFIPVLLITLLVLAAKGILDSLEDIMSSEEVSNKSQKEFLTPETADKSCSKAESFQLINSKEEDKSLGT